MNNPIRSSLVLFGLLVSSMAVGSRCSLAKGPCLQLTDLIEGLTPEQARKLVEMGSKVGIDSLDGLPTLDAETAKALAGFKGGLLSLYGLTSLSPEAAVSLKEYAGFIRFPGEVEKDLAARSPLNPDNARKLAKVLNGNLSGITVLDSPDSVAIADALATYE